MRVVAIQQGYYNERLIEPGQVFQINNDGDYHASWMRPAKNETEKPVKPPPHKTEEELRAEEDERQVHYGKLAGKSSAQAHGNASKKGEIEEAEEIDAPPPPSKRKKAAKAVEAEEVEGEEGEESEEAPPPPKAKRASKKVL